MVMLHVTSVHNFALIVQFLDCLRLLGASWIAFRVYLRGCCYRWSVLTVEVQFISRFAIEVQPYRQCERAFLFIFGCTVLPECFHRSQCWKLLFLVRIVWAMFRIGWLCDTLWFLRRQIRQTRLNGVEPVDVVSWTSKPLFSIATITSITYIPVR